MPWQIIILAILLQPVAAVGFAFLMRGHDRHRVKVLKRQRDEDFEVFKKERAAAEYELAGLMQKVAFEKSWRDHAESKRILLEYDLAKAKQERDSFKADLEKANGKFESAMLHISVCKDVYSRVTQNGDKHGILNWINPVIDRVREDGRTVSANFMEIGKQPYKVTVQPGEHGFAQQH